MGNSPSQRCSACGLANGPLTSHPLLDVPVCASCSTRYHSGEFTISEESRNEIFCRWCGEGTGTLFLCDSCPKSFCSGCIHRNFGLSEVSRIEALSERWNCIVCSPQSLEDLIEKNAWDQCSKLAGPVQKKSKLCNLPNIICPDISRGRERFPIAVFNDVDSEPAPLDFTYVTRHIAGEGVTISNNPSFVSCCSCTDNCKDPLKCECALLMGGFAYDGSGTYLSEKAGGIYECNQRCSCHLKRCKNRVVGKGPHLKLEVFRCSASKGWGVRCLTAIPAGTYVADYLGEIILESLADSRGLSGCDEYFFGMDAWGRSQACRRLTELGMKRGLHLIPREHEVDVSALSRQDIADLLDPELFKHLDKAGALDRATQNVKVQSKDEKNMKFCPPCSKPSKRKKSDIEPIIAHSSSSLSSSSSKDKRGKKSNPTNESDQKDVEKFSSSTWQSGRAIRIEAFEKARDIISDRIIVETEENNETFTVDARYEFIYLLPCCPFPHFTTSNRLDLRMYYFFM